jgi:hypothetical protein
MNSVLSVVTPAYSVDLTVLANVKAELGITVTTDDANLETWIDAASALITTSCNRVFGSETVLETFRVRGSYSTQWPTHEKVTLDRTPVTAFTSVIENGNTLVEGTDFECDRESGIMTRLSGDYSRRWDFRTLAVTYTGGYELLGTLPLPLERAAITLVKQYRSAASRDPLLKAEEIPGVLSQSWWVGSTGDKSTGVPQEVETLIAPYRHIAI